MKITKEEIEKLGWICEGPCRTHHMQSTIEQEEAKKWIMFLVNDNLYIDNGKIKIKQNDDGTFNVSDVVKNIYCLAYETGIKEGKKQQRDAILHTFGLDKDNDNFVKTRED